MPPPSSKPRHRIEVRLSTEERSHLEALSQHAGKTMSDYLRDRIESPSCRFSVNPQTYWKLEQIGCDIHHLIQMLHLAQQQGQSLQFSLQSFRDLLTLIHQVRAEIAGIRSAETAETDRYLIELSVTL